MLAVVAMTLNSLCLTIQMSLYRFAAKEGFHPADFTLFRNGFALLVSITWLMIVGARPFADFPWENKQPLWWRIFFG